MNSRDVAETMDEIFSLYEQHSNEMYIGEPVTTAQHSVQAAMLAEDDKQPTYVVIAALLHDVGHLIGKQNNLPEMITDDINIGTVRHEYIAGEFLRDKGFPDKIARLVEAHVDAKRYRVTVDKTYKLSAASAQTLEHQGGKMSAEEVESFSKRQDLDLVLKLREYDERAKDASVVCKPLDYYKTMCIKYLENVRA